MYGRGSDENQWMIEAGFYVFGVQTHVWIAVALLIPFKRCITRLASRGSCIERSSSACNYELERVQFHPLSQTNGLQVSWPSAPLKPEKAILSI